MRKPGSEWLDLALSVAVVLAFVLATTVLIFAGYCEQNGSPWR